MATREADGTIYTHAGPEIGVASTKAFTAQLVALYLLALHLAEVRGTLSAERARCSHIDDAAAAAAARSKQMLKSSPQIEDIAARFHTRTDFLYLGRGINYPIALEGALKLKEISYIHAEGYPAGEMKHGPIALIDEQMPVVAHRAARSRLREDAGQHPGGQGPRRLGHRDHHRRRRHARGDCSIADTDSIIAVPAMSPLLAPIVIVDAAAAALRTTSPCVAAATSISRGIWRRASR